MAQAIQWVAEAWRVTWEGTHPLATLEEGIKWPSKACPRCVVPQTWWTKATSSREAAYLDAQSALQSAARREALPGAPAPPPLCWALGCLCPPLRIHTEKLVCDASSSILRKHRTVYKNRKKIFFIYIVTDSSFILTVFSRKIQYFLIDEKWLKKKKNDNILKHTLTDLHIILTLNKSFSETF